MGLWLLLVVAAAVDDEPGPAGLKLGVSVDGGVLGGDVVVGGSVGVGVESDPFALHLKAPAFLRVVDVDPGVDRSLPSFCSWFRCEDVVDGTRLDPTAVARVLDELRLFRPNDVFSLRAGQLTASLGSGAVVERFTTASSWDRRTSGAFSAVHLPWKHLDVEALVGDVVSPDQLLALHVSLSPLDDLGWYVAAESAADLFAPVDRVDRRGSVIKGADTRPLTSTTLQTGWRLLDSAVDLAPRVEAGVVTGLSEDGGEAGEAGVGVGAGVDVGLDVGVVDARLKVTGSLGTPAFRRGLFQTLHLVERRTALVGASIDGGGLARVAAPGGAGLDVRLDASVWDTIAPLLRLHLENAAGGNAAEVGAIVDVSQLQFSLSVLRRGFVDVGSLVGNDVEVAPIVGAMAASWRFWGPLSLSVRWLRLPRFGGAGGLRIDDDVLFSVSANTVLTPS